MTTDPTPPAAENDVGDPLARLVQQQARQIKALQAERDAANVLAQSCVRCRTILKRRAIDAAIAAKANDAATRAKGGK